MPLSVAIITSWPSSINGIADYSKRLYIAMAKLTPLLKLTILADILYNSTIQTSIECNNVYVKRVWSDKTLPLDIPKLVKEVVASDSRIVHIQYEYWLYGRGIGALIFLLLLPCLKLIRRKIVMTLHGLIPLSSFENSDILTYHKIPLPLRLAKYASLIYIKLLCSFSDIVIVHLRIMRKVLEKQYGINAEKVCIIPHGVDEVGQANAARNSPLKRIFLVFGSIRPDKGIEHIIKAFTNVIQRGKHNDARLIIAGQYDEKISPESKGYIDSLTKNIKHLGLEEKVQIFFNVTYERVKKLYTSAYVIILNYLDRNVLAASGPLALAIAYGRPPIVTKIPRFLEFKDYVIFVKAGDEKQLTKAIKVLIENTNLYSTLRSKLLHIRSVWCWRKIAIHHLNLYIRTLNA